MPASNLPALIVSPLAIVSIVAVSAAAPPDPVDAVAVTDTLRTAADCLQCHAPGAELEKWGLPLEKLFDPSAAIDYRISPEKFLDSNHGKLGCRICHIVGREVYPHLEAASGHNFVCTECHERQVDEAKFDVEKIRKEFTASVHVQKLGDRFTCHACHDPHVFKLATPDKKPSEIIRDNNAVCLRCHDVPNHFEALTDRRFPVIRVTHGWLHDLELDWSAIRCVRCHTESTEGFSHQILAGSQAQKSCVVCHSHLMEVTRSVALDWRVLSVMLVVVLGIGGRSLARWVAARRVRP